VPGLHSVTVAAAAAAGVLLVTFDIDASSAATGSHFWTKRRRISTRW